MSAGKKEEFTLFLFSIAHIVTILSVITFNFPGAATSIQTQQPTWIANTGQTGQTGQVIAGGQPQVIAQTGQAGQPVIMGQVVQAAGQAAPLLIQQPQVGLLDEYSCILHLNLGLKDTED